MTTPEQPTEQTTRPEPLPIPAGTAHRYEYDRTAGDLIRYGDELLPGWLVLPLARADRHVWPGWCRVEHTRFAPDQDGRTRYVFVDGAGRHWPRAYGPFDAFIARTGTPAPQTFTTEELCGDFPFTYGRVTWRDRVRSAYRYTDTGTVYHFDAFGHLHAGRTVASTFATETAAAILAAQPTDDLADAIDTIAAHLIASAVETAADRWEDYADIGEHDWQSIVARAHELSARPDQARQNAAYDILAARADQ